MRVRMLVDTYIGDVYYKSGQVFDWPDGTPLPSRTTSVGGEPKVEPLAVEVNEDDTTKDAAQAEETAPTRKRKSAAEAKSDA